MMKMKCTIYRHIHNQMDRKYPTGAEGKKRLLEIAEKIK
jgi:hypothetical protein